MEKQKSKKNIAITAFIALIIISFYVLYRYISFSNNYINSDAVFVKSDSLTNLSFKLSGKVNHIFVKEGDKVSKGEVLANLDTKSLEIQKQEIQFSIDSMKATIKSLILKKEKLKSDVKNNLSLVANKKEKLEKNINSFKYDIKVINIKQQKAKDDFKRYTNLYKKNKISKEKYEDKKSLYLELNNQIKSSQEKLKVLKLESASLEIQKNMTISENLNIQKIAKDIIAKQNTLKALEEKKSLIQQKIKDSFIYAPFSGIIAKKFSNDDEVVSAGKIILTEVNLKDIYILDLLEEKKLKGIQKGCKAVIHIDSLDKNFNGYVSEILPASASTFSLVPRDIASGEFTKLQQRFYVKIKFNHIPKNIKVGMAGEVEIKKIGE